MVPGEIFYDALTRCVAQALHDFRMPVQMFECRHNCVDISGLDDDSLYSIAHYVAGFARRDDWQTASRRLVNNFRAAFPLRRENVDGALVQIIFRVAHKSDRLDVVAPKLFQIWFGFFVHRADQPQFRLLQI
jgi:hypothetical protein